MAAESLVASAWAAWHELLGPSQQFMFAVTMTAVHNAAFYGYNSFLYLIQRFKWLQQYKVEVGKMPPADLQRSAFRELLLNHWVLYPVLVYYGIYPMLKHRLDFGPTLPSLWTALGHIAVLMACEDTAFYWSHRLLHHRLLYKWVHKRHHEFKYNIGIAAEYDHPVEVAVIYLCLVAGLVFVKPHAVVFFAWLFLRVIEAVDSHSGYRFPWSPFQLLDRLQGGAQRHEFHHSHNVGSYGSWTTFWDALMVLWRADPHAGTDVAYRAYQITQTRDVHRRWFRHRSRQFTCDLADLTQHSMASKLHAHALSSTLDTWCDVTLDGQPVADWKGLQIPKKGTLVFTVHQQGFWGRGAPKRD